MVVPLAEYYTTDRVNPKDVYWRDAISPQGFGPFTTLFQAMEHYSNVKKAFKAGIDPIDRRPVAEAIQVDFFKKKRIDDNTSD
jgi:hypothetical protein